jgi:plastocyanin
VLSVSRTQLRTASAYAVVAVLLLLTVVPLLVARPAHAAVTHTIELTINGPKPASLTAAVGDTIQFKNTDATFVHQVESASTNWEFRSPPLAPGQVYPVPGKLTKPGDYLYKGANLDTFSGKVTVPGAVAPPPSPARSPAASPRPSPAAQPSSAPASPAPAPSSTGGSGVVGAPPITGGFGSGGFPSAAPSPGGPAPNVAPTLAGEEVPSAAPSGPTVAVGHGRLPEPPTGRKYGLPAALAAVGAAGVASLLVRLLLAHPAARRARHAAGRGDRTVTVD